ncbi:hypothetical protein B9L19_17250 [Geobacillus thermocatenulatus]|uniref:Uncharacterized protein n=1 Tax=Geobacillus thermocatenulatus TaxID=33938 RepID=A0A226Q592_9BACL|nr:hypothetical protein GT3921_00210 [Geobacillus thermocatenulatus]KLR74984.1 hypothetical protein ABH20_02765 [Geobacillus sp. T6]OXB87154.1 hypothetical protein B9L19_17250 [Geobacillus thermocatenulatus]RAN30572.1 hypothetical protein VC88_02040 [Geobacillus sp. A8]
MLENPIMPFNSISNLHLHLGEEPQGQYLFIRKSSLNNFERIFIARVSTVTRQTKCFSTLDTKGMRGI